MYVFGGKDEDNEKLKDFWEFDFNTNTWAQIDCENNTVVARSGHSACIFEDHMVIFAGIHEVTKELDDMAAYSFKDNKWLHLFSEPVSSKQTIGSGDPSSPKKIGGK